MLAIALLAASAALNTPSPMRTSRTPPARMAVATSAPTLSKLSDNTFQQMVLGADEPVVIDFAADYCGPCRMVEPALTRLNTMNGVKVVKAALDENAQCRAWLLSYGVQITALPTLVLVRNGAPIRTFFGADKILQQSKLHDFALNPTGEALAPVAQQRSQHREAPNFFSQLTARLGFAF